MNCRSEVLRVFDQTFAITYSLEFIAIIVAFLGIINSLNALVIERQRDIGIFRAIGAFRKQVEKTVLIEAGVIGFFSYVLGLLCGLLLSILLIYVINKQSFGWTIQFSIPLRSLVESGVLVMVDLHRCGPDSQPEGGQDERRRNIEDGIKNSYELSVRSSEFFNLSLFVDFIIFLLCLLNSELRTK